VDVARLGIRLREACSAFAVPGAQVGVLREGERVVLCEGAREYGGGGPVEPSTPFRAGSLAKAVTALLVLDADVRSELDVEVPCDQQSSAPWDDTPLAIMA